MLSRRPLSAAMLEQKLLDKGFAPEAADYAVQRMRLLRAIDDEAYAEMLIRSYRNKGYGAKRIRQELYQRGVPKDTAAQQLRNMEPNWEKMHALLEKKLKKRGLHPLFITGHTGWTDNMEFAFAHKNELCSPFKKRAHDPNAPYDAYDESDDTEEKAQSGYLSGVGR